MRHDPRTFLIAAAQAAAVRTSRVPLALRVYLRLYDQVLARAGARLARVEGVAQVLVRVEDARPWAPGLSDIDLTVLLHELAPKDRWLTLERLWSAHLRLKRSFPMVGEMSVLSASELGAFVRGGPGPAAILKRYVPVAGEPTRAERRSIEHALSWDRAHVTTRRIHRFALMRFVDVGCVLLARAMAKPTHVAWAMLRRSMEQQCFRLSRLGVTPPDVPAGAHERDVQRLFARVVRALDGVAQSLGSTSEEVAWSNGHAAPRARLRGADVRSFRGFGAQGANRCMVVLDSSSEESVLSAIEAMTPEVRATKAPTSFAIVTRPMWAEWRELAFLENPALSSNEESIAHEVAECLVRRHARSELDVAARHAHLRDVSLRLRRCAEALGVPIADPPREALHVYEHTEQLLRLLIERLNLGVDAANDLERTTA